MLKVISGILKKRKLDFPKINKVRPTTNKVKEAIFNAIQFVVKDSIFLDLFSGSGQMGIEAISRGAKKTIFVDKDSSSIKIIKKNLNNLKINKKVLVIKSNALIFLKETTLKFDIAFLDPPYKSNLLEEVFNLVKLKMSENGIIICETSNKKINENFLTKKTYSYGKINVDIYKK